MTSIKTKILSAKPQCAQEARTVLGCPWWFFRLQQDAVAAATFYKSNYAPAKTCPSLYDVGCG